MIITKCPSWESFHMKMTFDRQSCMPIPDEPIKDWCSSRRRPCTECLSCPIKELVTYCLDRDLPIQELMGVKE